VQTLNPLLRKLGHYTRLARQEQAVLSSLAGARLRQFGPREDILGEGERPEFMYLILQGWACRYKMLEDGRRQIIAFFLPGDVCDLNIFVLRHMDHSIGTITPVSVGEIPRNGFDEMVAAYPRVHQALWWESHVTSAIQREWVVNVGQRDAAERMAHLFCEIFHRLRAVGFTDGNSCEMPLTQGELGEATGLSAVHVNRTLQDMRAANLIVLRGKTLSIPDLEALERSAMFDPGYLHLEHEGRHLDANEA
jgi:CRP-like cAMP-binding protein